AKQIFGCGAKMLRTGICFLIHDGYRSMCFMSLTKRGEPGIYAAMFFNLGKYMLNPVFYFAFR
ncbi:hypothetical protein J5224_33345, partial [Candidatus Symbiopectobacterium sp. NZEC135]|nr:hypothetical protein [Candidatus Symbiopectobacterium sp. NZEC135]